MTTASRRAPSEDEDRLHEIPQLLFGVTEQVRSTFESACGEFELTPPQARTLLALEEPRQMRWLADVLRCDASNVTGIADRLEARGLATRQSDEQDRRVRLLALTKRGHVVRRKIRSMIERRSPLITNLSEQERETLRALLAKIALRPDEQPAPRR